MEGPAGSHRFTLTGVVEAPLRLGHGLDGKGPDLRLRVELERERPEQRQLGSEESPSVFRFRGPRVDQSDSSVPPDAHRLLQRSAVLAVQRQSDFDDVAGLRDLKMRWRAGPTANGRIAAADIGVLRKVRGEHPVHAQGAIVGVQWWPFLEP